MHPTAMIRFGPIMAVGDGVSDRRLRRYLTNL
jgi:hypothetical protein